MIEFFGELRLADPARAESQRAERPGPIQVNSRSITSVIMDLSVRLLNYHALNCILIAKRASAGGRTRESGQRPSGGGDHTA